MSQNLQLIAEAVGVPGIFGEQEAVVTAPTQPVLVLAGAGAGKTATMTMRVLHLIDEYGMNPERILGLTFSRKAAGELGAKMRSATAKFRTLKGIADDLTAPQATTYNSFAYNVVREYGMHIGLNPDLRLIGRAQAVVMMSEVIRSKIELPAVLDGVSETSLVKYLLDLSGKLDEHCLSIDEAREAFADFSAQLSQLANGGDGTGTLSDVMVAQAKREAVLDLVVDYRKAKIDAGVIDFGDQLGFATRIVHERPDVVAEIRAEHEAVLLDEFQDTSVVQMKFLSRLFADHPVTAVGDPNQAIYGWRGASASSLESFYHHFDSSEESDSREPLNLSTAYRNDRRILTVANRVAQPLRDAARIAKSPILQSRSNAGDGVVEMRYVPTAAEQLNVVVDYMLSHGGGEGTSPLSRAVLCRSRADLAAVERAMRKAGIPAFVVGSEGLLNQPPVADVRAALEVAANVHSSQWLMRLLAAQDIGVNDIRVLGDWAAHLAKERAQTAADVNVELGDGTEIETGIGASAPDEDSRRKQRHEALLIDAVDNPPPLGWKRSPSRPSISDEGLRRIQVLGQRLRRIRKNMTYSVGTQVERAAQILGIVEDMIADPVVNNGRESLDAFLDIARTFSTDSPTADLHMFLTWLAIADEEERGLAMPRSAAPPGAVELLTVHASKGLEWDIVAVYGLSDGRFPGHRGVSIEWRQPPSGSSGWLTNVSELPYDMRGDARDLPSLTGGMSAGSLVEAMMVYQVDNKSRTLASAFNNYVKAELRPEFGAHDEREERRVAYVALTRARSHMLMAGSWLNTSKTPQFPSRYFEEARDELKTWAHKANLIAQGEVKDPIECDLSAELCREKGFSVAEVGHRDYCIALDRAVDDAPETEDIEELLEKESYEFPRPISETRMRIINVATAVRQRFTALGDGNEAFAQLREKVDEFNEQQRTDLVAQITRDTLALLEERRLNAVQGQSVDIPVSRMSATRMTALTHDPEGYLRNLRRPLPMEPSQSATFGTIFHQWIEQELRMSGGEENIDPVPILENLEGWQRAKMRTMMKNFSSLDLLATHQVIGIEEPFSLDVAGVKVQGRIDAVLRDANGRDMVVDWKSGKALKPDSDPETIDYYLTQLLLYRQAWAQRHRVSVDQVGTGVVFLTEPVMYTVEDLAGFLGLQELPDLDNRMKETLPDQIAD